MSGVVVGYREGCGESLDSKIEEDVVNAKEIYLEADQN